MKPKQPPCPPSSWSQYQLFLELSFLIYRPFAEITFLLAPSRLRAARLPVQAVPGVHDSLWVHTVLRPGSQVSTRGKGLPLQWSEHSFIITRWARYSHRKKKIPGCWCLAVFDSCGFISVAQFAMSQQMLAALRMKSGLSFPPYKGLGEVTVTYSGK